MPSVTRVPAAEQLPAHAAQPKLPGKAEVQTTRALSQTMPELLAHAYPVVPRARPRAAIAKPRDARSSDPRQSRLADAIVRSRGDVDDHTPDAAHAADVTNARSPKRPGHVAITANPGAAARRLEVSDPPSQNYSRWLQHS
jgi:hypothetical protein